MPDHDPTIHPTEFGQWRCQYYRDRLRLEVARTLPSSFHMKSDSKCISLILRYHESSSASLRVVLMPHGRNQPRAAARIDLVIENASELGPGQRHWRDVLNLAGQSSVGQFMGYRAGQPGNVIIVETETNADLLFDDIRANHRPLTDWIIEKLLSMVRDFGPYMRDHF